MAKKEKEQPMLNFDGNEYVIEEMSDESKQILNHINDMQNKLRTNMFVNEQLVASEKHFAEKLEEGKTQLKAVLESEEKAAA